MSTEVIVLVFFINLAVLIFSIGFTLGVMALVREVRVGSKKNKRS